VEVDGLSREMAAIIRGLRPWVAGLKPQSGKSWVANSESAAGDSLRLAPCRELDNSYQGLSLERGPNGVLFYNQDKSLALHYRTPSTACLLFFATSRRGRL